MFIVKDIFGWTRLHCRLSFAMENGSIDRLDKLDKNKLNSHLKELIPGLTTVVDGN